MKVFILSTIVFIFSNITDIRANETENSSFYERLKKEVLLNKGKSKSEQNYFMYVNGNAEDIEDELMLGNEWLEERQEGIIPLKSTYLDLLNEYNNTESAKINGKKAQHYIMVVDIAPAIFLKVKDLPGYDYHNYFNASEDEYSYDKILQQEISKARDDFNKDFAKPEGISIADPDEKLYWSLIIVNRRILNGKLRSYKFEYCDMYEDDAEASNTYEQVIIEEFLPEVEKMPKFGFSFLGSLITKFIQVFHDYHEDIVTCNNSEYLGFQSEAALGMYNYFCEGNGYDLTDSGFALAVYKSSKYLDYMQAFLTTTGNSETTALISSHRDLIQSLLEEYYPNRVHNIYPIWLKTNWQNQFTKHLGEDYQFDHHHNEYLEVFFNLNDLLGSQQMANLTYQFDMLSDETTKQAYFLSRSLIGSLRWYETAAEYLLAHESVSDDFVNSLNDAYDTELFTQQDKEDLFTLIKFNRDVLWNFYFNPLEFGVPGVGFKATEIAETVAAFLKNYKVEFDNINYNYNYTAETVQDKDFVSEKKQILIGFKKPFYAQTHYGEVVSEENQLVKEISVKQRNAYEKIDFTIQVYTEFEYKSVGGTSPYQRWYISSPDSENFSHVGQSDAPDFFEEIVTVNIHSPNIFKERTYKNQAKLVIEYAFVTATRIRDKATDRGIEQALLAVEIIALPFSILELAAAKGVYFLLRGIVVATEVSSVVIAGAGNGSFEEGCIKLMGEELGTSAAPILQGFFFLVAVPDIISGVGNFFTKDELINAAATSNYYRKMKVHEIPVDGKIPADQLAYYDQYIRKMLVENNVPNAEELIEAAKLKLLGLDELSDVDLKNNEILQKLIAEYHYKKKDTHINWQANNNILQTDKFLDGLSVAEQNKLKFMLNSESSGDIVKLISDSDDVILNSRRLEALKDLLKLDVCF